jgi:hypothetical protein
MCPTHALTFMKFYRLPYYYCITHVLNPEKLNARVFYLLAFPTLKNLQKKKKNERRGNVPLLFASKDVT